MTEATPHYGAPPFVFGMTIADALAAAGAPDALERKKTDGVDPREIWKYLSAQIELEFYGDEGWRLGSITLSSPSSTINGVALVGCSADSLANNAAKVGITDIVMTGDFGENGRRHESEQCNLMFWEYDGKIVDATLWPAYDDSGNVAQWPDR